MGAGGKARAILDTVNKRVAEAYSVLDLGVAKAFLSSASGQWLDLFGDVLACPRLPSVAAGISEEAQAFKWYVASGTFGDINGGADITISRGQLISSDASDSGVLYRVAADVTCPAASNSVWFSAEALTPGEASNVGSNSLRFHSFTSYTDYANNTLLVTNVHPIGNGRDYEGDANYKYRLSRRVLEAEAANETAIRLAALSTPGVADVIMIPYYRGIGTFAVIIKSIQPTVSTSLVDDVKTRISKVQGYSSVAHVKGPRETGFSCRLKITYSKQLTEDELLAIESQIQDVVISSVNALDIGETLYVSRIIASLYSISTMIVSVGEQGKLTEESYIYKSTRLGDSRVRQTLISDYVPQSDERVIIEPSLSAPITLSRVFQK